MRLPNELTVTVPKKDLLETLKRNRDSHEEEYRLAKDGFRIKLREELEAKLAALDAGEAVELRISERPPDHYYEEYQDIIEMLEMALDEKIELTRDQFKCWVKDEWGWKGQWVAANSEYVTAASVGR